MDNEVVGTFKEEEKKVHYLGSWLSTGVIGFAWMIPHFGHGGNLMFVEISFLKDGERFGDPKHAMGLLDWGLGNLVNTLWRNLDFRSLVNV